MAGRVGYIAVSALFHKPARPAMKIIIRPADEGACGQLRMRLPALATGLDVFEQIEPLAARWIDPQTVHHLERQLEADVFVLQRPLTADWVAAIPAIQAQGVAVVVEIDDNFQALPRENQAWPHAQREWLDDLEARRLIQANKYSPSYLKTVRQRIYDDGPHRSVYWRFPEGVSNHHKGHLAKACRLADLVTCTTEALARQYAPHGRYRIIPNCIPGHYLNVTKPPSDGRLRVGWTGVVGTHPGDLEACGEGVADAMNGTDALFRCWHSDRPANVLGVKNREVVPWVSLEDYAGTVAELDVGLVPLAETPFNQSKSWLKGLEYAALGVPFIASPTDPYELFFTEGAGTIAHDPENWRHSVACLLERSALRTEFAEQGRAVASRWTIEGNGHRWADAWETAVKIRREGKAA